MKLIVCFLCIITLLGGCSAMEPNSGSLKVSQVLPESATINTERQETVNPQDYEEYFSQERVFNFERTPLDNDDFACYLDDSGILCIKDKADNTTTTPLKSKVERLYRYDNILYAQTQEGIIRYDMIHCDAVEIYSGQISPVKTLSATGQIIPLEGSSSLLVNPQLAFFMRGECVYRYYIPTGTEEMIYKDSKIISFMPLSNIEILVTRVNPQWEKCVAETGNTESGIAEFEEIKYKSR